MVRSRVLRIEDGKDGGPRGWEMATTCPPAS